MRLYFFFLLFLLSTTSVSFAKEASVPRIQLTGKEFKIVCKNIVLSQRVFNKISDILKTKEANNFQLYYFWMLTSENCFQLCVAYQENGQWVVSSVDPPASGGGFIGATQVCLDDYLNPGSQYNSFNNMC